jgi:hypothetical protein
MTADDSYRKTGGGTLSAPPQGGFLLPLVMKEQ